MSIHAHIDLSLTESLAHKQICQFKVMVTEYDGIGAEKAPGDFELLGMVRDDEYSISPVSFSFLDLRSMMTASALCEQQLVNLRPDMRPETRDLLVYRIVDFGMKLVSLHGEDDVDFGYLVDARLDVEYVRVADEEDLALCRQFDEAEDDEDGIEDGDRDDIEGFHIDNHGDGVEAYDNEDDIEGVDIDNYGDGVEAYDNEDDIEGVDIDNYEDGIEAYDNEDDIEGLDIDNYEDGMEADDEDIDEDDDMDADDEANPRFRGVEEGEYDGGYGKEAITCSVCLEDVSSGMEFNRLPCSHIFHRSCINPWLKRNRSCPNCRTELEELDEAGQSCDLEFCVWCVVNR